MSRPSNEVLSQLRAHLYVTVAVDDEQVLELAEAAENSEVMIVRSTGAPPPRSNRDHAGSDGWGTELAMIEPELALALSAREWSDHLRRFLADHGGAHGQTVAALSHTISQVSHSTFS